jgi:copper homeostasis protein
MNYSSETKLNRVLTSGGEASAIDGMQKILLMRKNSESSAISIIAGSGINHVNARSLVDYTGVNEIHLGTGVRHNGELDKSLFKQLLTSLE